MFLRAFTRTWVELELQPRGREMPAEMDQIAAYKAEHSAALVAATAYWEQDGSTNSLLIMRASLQPEVELMDALLAQKRLALGTRLLHWQKVCCFLGYWQAFYFKKSFLTGNQARCPQAFFCQSFSVQCWSSHSDMRIENQKNRVRISKLSWLHGQKVLLTQTCPSWK